MKSSILFVSLVALALAGCGTKWNPRQHQKPGPIGEEMSADLEPGHAIRHGIARRIVLPGTGAVTITADPVNQTSKLDVSVFQPSSRLPTAQGSSPLEIPELAPGEYVVVVRPLNSVATRVKLLVGFKPKDYDAASGEDGKPDGARELAPGKASREKVDALAMDRTDWYELKLKESGNLKLTFKAVPTRGKITAEVQPPKGDPVLIDPRNGFENPDAVAGSWLVKVAADETGVGPYTLDAVFETGDLEKGSGDDALPEGAGEMNLKSKGGSTNLVATVKDEVSYEKRDRTDHWKIDLPDKGRLSVILKTKDKASKVRAEFLKSDQEDDGDRIRSGFNVDVQKQAYFVKVFAPDKGDQSAYTLEVEYYPENYLDSRVVEIDRRSGCALMVDKGTNQGVRQGSRANVMSADKVAAEGTVEQSWAVLSRIKVFSGDCRFAAGTVVKIQSGM